MVIFNLSWEAYEGFCIPGYLLILLGCVGALAVTPASAEELSTVGVVLCCHVYVFFRRFCVAYPALPHQMNF